MNSERVLMGSEQHRGQDLLAKATFPLTLTFYRQPVKEGYLMVCGENQVWRRSWAELQSGRLRWFTNQTGDTSPEARQASTFPQEINKSRLTPFALFKPLFQFR